MSNTSNQIVSIWEAVENSIFRRIPKYYQNTDVLDAESRIIVRDAYMLWYLCTWDSLQSFGVQFTTAETNRWIISITSVTVRELVDLLKESSHLLVTGEFETYDDFKHHLNKSFPLAGAILAPLKRIFHHWWSESDTNALYLLYSWLLFISRLNLTGLKQLEDEAMDKYLKIEDDLQGDGFTPEEKDTLQKWFPRSLKDRVFLQEHHRPQHGPGCTSDAGVITQEKYDSLCTDPKLSMLHRKVYGDGNAYPRPCGYPLVRRSKTIFVPKSLGAYRTISMEPASIMWHQKGVRNALTLLLKRRRHYILRRFQPENQQSNRDLSWRGSLDGSFATIDLSSASDTVSWSLVKEWFFNTSLYPWLLWTRSTHTELPSGEVIKLKKFAPMGSDLSFPIETFIFTAITECAITECGGDPNLSEFRVYGDDIVVEDEYASAVLRRLVQNGFIPNLGKTFSGSQPRGFFRESCGGFFFNGVDITPVRISRRFTGYTKLDVSNPGRIESLIELANDCFSRYPSVRRWCINQLLRFKRQLQPPFSSDGSVGLFSTQPTNFHLFVKESQTLQCNVYTFGISKHDACTRDEEWEDIRLFEYLRQTQFRERLTWPEDRVDVDVSPVPLPLWKSKRAALY